MLQAILSRYDIVEGDASGKFVPSGSEFQQQGSFPFPGKFNTVYSGQWYFNTSTDGRKQCQFQTNFNDCVLVPTGELRKQFFYGCKTNRPRSKTSPNTSRSKTLISWRRWGGTLFLGLTEDKPGWFKGQSIVLLGKMVLESTGDRLGLLLGNLELLGESLPLTIVVEKMMLKRWLIIS